MLISRTSLLSLALVASALPGASLAAAPAAFDEAIGAAKASMMAEPDKALGHARAAAAQAARLADANKRALATAEAQWLEGEALVRLNQPEPARPIIAAARATAAKLAPGSKLEGDIVIASATIEWTSGKVPLALEQFQNAYTIYAALKDARGQSKALQYIGSIYFDARDYPRMLKYYAQSAEVYQGDPPLMIAAFNNQGDALKELKRFPEAIANYGRALEVAREIDSPVLEVRILTNLASAYYQRGDLRRAEAFAARGLERARGHDTGWEPFIYGVRAQIALARGNLGAAESEMARTFLGQDLAKTTVQFREFHDAARRLYARIGNPGLALEHMTAFKRLDDEARDVAASTNGALLGARFDFANQELNIAKLKADRLQGAVELERSKVRLNTVTLAGLLAALAVAALVAIGATMAFVSIRRSRNAVRAANDELSSTNSELEKALGAKTRFLATTSHEIRTPLNGILGMTEVMLHDTALPEAQRERIRIVHDAGATMKALVDDILDVAKIETGKLTIDSETVELRPLLEGVARLWSGQAQTKGLEVSLDLADCPERILGDTRRLRQIVFNLMSNAVKFTERGFVTLSAACGPGELRLSVSDSGIGIPDDEIEAIFKSFHQVDGAVTRRFGGTGLGLAICRDLARAMGGEVRVESAPGIGSTFTVVLPLTLVEAEAQPAPDVGPARLSEATVLLVENNPLTRSIVKAALGAHVGTVLAVPANEAGEAARRLPPFAVLDLASFVDRAALDALIGQLGDARLVFLNDARVSPDILSQLEGTVLTRPVAIDDLLSALGGSAATADRKAA